MIDVCRPASNTNHVHEVRRIPFRLFTAPLRGFWLLHTPTMSHVYIYVSIPLLDRTFGGFIDTCSFFVYR